VARPRQKNFVERLAGAGEEAMQRIGSAPGADKVLGALGSLKDRVDELQKSVRTIDKLEKRLGTIEKRLEKLEGKGSSTSRKTSSAKRKTAVRKPSSSS
jgi:prefoldin subunit 5